MSDGERQYGISLVEIAPDGSAHSLGWAVDERTHAFFRSFTEGLLGVSTEDTLTSAEGLRKITDATQENSVFLGDETDEPAG